MYLKAVVETGGTLVAALPNEAIIDFQGKKYIFIKTEEGHEQEESKETTVQEMKGQHFRMQEITVGNSELGYTEVVLADGWNNENKVVIKGAYSILSKMKNSEEGGHH
jgi:cobalt-zinc-cadmium efflux system membrane fusion protein